MIFVRSLHRQSPKAGDKVLHVKIGFSYRKKTSFREEYILRVNYNFKKKININKLKFYNNHIFLINNNCNCGHYFYFTLRN